MNVRELHKRAKMIRIGVRLYYANRSLRAWGGLFVYLFRRMSGRSVPPFIFIALTYKCQCRCVHCFAHIPGRDEKDILDISQLKSAIDQAKQLGVLGVIFSGGEPLMKKGLEDLVRHAHDAGLLTRVDTNGLLLDHEHIASLKRAGVTQFAVSIDDADPAIHDSLRNIPSSYKKAIEGIRLLRQFNIPCQIFSYISKRNVTEGIEKIIDLARQLRVLCLQFIFPVAAGRWDERFDQLLTTKEKEKIWQLKLPGFVYVISPSPGALCPIYTKSTLYITAQGDVTPCPFIPYVIGSIRHEELGKVWERHCAHFDLEFLGDCPMNNRQARRQLKRYTKLLRKKL